jgi:hypothetical protein
VIIFLALGNMRLKSDISCIDLSPYTQNKKHNIRCDVSMVIGHDLDRDSNSIFQCNFRVEIRTMYLPNMRNSSLPFGPRPKVFAAGKL